MPGAQPPVIFLRSADQLAPDQHPALPAANLSAVSGELKTGALVSIARGRLRSGVLSGAAGLPPDGRIKQMKCMAQAHEWAESPAGPIYLLRPLPMVSRAR
ncbi:MAG TPA: hypothetical protein VF070_45780 [Streptosporangiaceae bacterium]